MYCRSNLFSHVLSFFFFFGTMGHAVRQLVVNKNHYCLVKEAGLRIKWAMGGGERDREAIRQRARLPYRSTQKESAPHRRGVTDDYAYNDRRMLQPASAVSHAPGP